MPFQQSRNSTRVQPAQKKTSMIKRSLIISVINLCTNLPIHILRFLLTIEMAQKILPDNYMIIFEGVSQILFFSQYTCNAFYLSTTIYETSSVPTRPCALLTSQHSNSVSSTPAPNRKNTIFYADFV